MVSAKMLSCLVFTHLYNTLLSGGTYHHKIYNKGLLFHSLKFHVKLHNAYIYRHQNAVNGHLFLKILYKVDVLYNTTPSMVFFN